MARPVSAERLASFQTLLPVLCGVLLPLKGSSQQPSACLGDMHIPDCRLSGCSQY